MQMTHLPLVIEVDPVVGVATLVQQVGDHPQDKVTLDISRDQAIMVAEFLLKAFKVRKSETISGDDTGFDEFWQRYPSKEGKQTALSVWKRDGCAKLLAQIMADVDRRMQSKQWHDGYVPHPTTYLRQKRYMDDQEVQSANPWDNAL